jgi:hypothetical protein
MQEIKQDLFECIFDPDVDAICITTNGHYTRDGVAVMGGGCAGEAARRWPEMPVRLGKMLRTFMSNIPFVIGAVDENGEALELTADTIKERKFKCLVFSYPTIHNLVRGSELGLIKQSAQVLVDYVTQYNLKKVILPRPGVGIGGLTWKEVKPEIENILDDRFVIVSFDHEE